MRARLAAWVSLGETLAFDAKMDCAAGLFRLVDDRVKSAMPLAGSLHEALHTLRRAGRVALDDRRQSPDQGIVDAANAERPVGMAMRGAALEGRACMSAGTGEAFHRALTARDALLIWDAESGALILLDRARGLLIVTMGAR